MRRLALGIALVLTGVLEPGTAGAQDWQRWAGAGAIEMDLRVSQLRDPGLAGGLEHSGIAGVGLRGFAGKRFGIVAGIDARFGAGAGGGFAYEVAVLPLGLGVHAGPFLVFGITTGLGVSGVTDHVPFALETPVEARLNLALGRHLNLTTWASASWVAASDAREDGSSTLSFADEFTGGLTLRLGRGGSQYRQKWGNGIYVGALLRERLATRELGLIVGYGITMGFFPEPRPTPRGL